MDAAQTGRGSRKLLAHLTVAGTAAIAASAANAQITVVPVNENVGFANGDLRSFTASLPGAAQFTIDRAGIYVFDNGRLVIDNAIVFSNTYLSVRAHNIVAPAAPAGKTFNQIGTRSASTAWIAAVLPDGSSTPNGAFHDQYFAFKFQDATNSNQADYGWIEASLTDTSYQGLNLNIVEYAYDVSGANIQTGQVSSVPEPSPMLAGAAFSALCLGAAGVRRLKALQN